MAREGGEDLQIIRSGKRKGHQSTRREGGGTMGEGKGLSSGESTSVVEGEKRRVCFQGGMSTRWRKVEALLRNVFFFSGTEGKRGCIPLQKRKCLVRGGGDVS